MGNNMKIKNTVATVTTLCVLSSIAFVYGFFFTERTSASAEEETIMTIPEDKNIRLETNKESINLPNENDSLAASSELEIHINEKPIYTLEEVDALIDEGIIKYERDGKQTVSCDKYVSEIKVCQFDNNSVELKSYIYHMMLNSVDYFNNAEGAMTYALNLSEPVDINFQTDIKKGLSYESESQIGSAICETYASDEIIYTINSRTGKYTETYCAAPIEFIISDNDRIIVLDNGETMKINRNDVTNLGIAGNSCLFPQSYAAAYLCDFDTWTITDTVDVLGRQCVEIEGEDQEQRFSMIVDVYTGIMMKYAVFNESGALTGYTEVSDISIDKKMDVNRFNKELYTPE